MILNFSELRVYFERRLRCVIRGTDRAAVNLGKKLHTKLERTWGNPNRGYSLINFRIHRPPDDWCAFAWSGLVAVAAPRPLGWFNAAPGGFT